MLSKRSKATQQILAHLERVQNALAEFDRDRIDSDRVVRPHFHAASLKVAREELSKAIAIMERTKWGTLD